MYVTISPRLCMSEVMSCVKGKSSLMIFDQHPEFRQGWGNCNFGERGYFVAILGNVNESTSVEDIKKEENDRLEDGGKSQLAAISGNQY